MILSFLSLWIKKSVWLWGPILVISYLLAMLSGLAELVTLVPISLLLACHIGLCFQLPPIGRIFFIVAAALISIGLKWEIIKGFQDIVFATQIQRTKDAMPYDVWLNFGTPFIGLFPLALTHSLLKGKEWLRFSYTGFLWAVVSSIIVLFILFSAKWITFHPRLNSSMLSWYVFLVFLQIIPEEGFFRGFLQKQMCQVPIVGFNILSFIVVALLFGLNGLLIAQTMTFFLFNFCMSLILSLLYQYTRQIEAAIGARMIITFVHFFLFSYPMLS